MLRMNPFASVPSVPSGQEVLDVCFRRASKVKPRVSKRADKLIKVKYVETAKLDSASSLISDQLTNIVKGFPSLDSVDPFYKEIADIIIGLDRLRQALGALDGYRQVIKNLSRDYIRRMRSAPSVENIRKLRRMAYGRLSSIMRKAGARLNLLGVARERLRKIVSINTDEPTIVVAGSPNVGKSSLVRLISSAKPEVAEYPFTTRSLIIGHLTHGKRRIQVIDTPGLLDRPISERNPLELQAITALRHLGKMMIFLFDPTEICGYTLGTQLNVFSEIKDLFKEIATLVVLNKIDVTTKEQSTKVKQMIPKDNIIFEISAVTGEGVGALIDAIHKSLDTLALPERASKESITPSRKVIPRHD
jgi:nucleolar GTP-binding protein